MSDQDPQTPKPMDLGVYDRPEKGMGAADLIAVILSVIWLIAIAAYAIVLSPIAPDTSGAVMGALFLAAVFPIALIWVGAMTIKTARAMRDEAARLHQSMDGMRKAYLEHAKSTPQSLESDVERRLDEIAASQKITARAIETFATNPSAALPRTDEKPALIQPSLPRGESQPGLALGTPADAIQSPISVDDFIGALNFPEDENDAEGFRRLRLALADQNSSRLIRASQDVLTLLSQDGIYMDDLRPDKAKAEVWRMFAAGERGRAVAGLGGVHDRSSLALTSGRMRSDPVFRDAVHHFLRQFDKTFVAFSEGATDSDIARLAETRTARAFMLLGRATGTFD